MRPEPASRPTAGGAPTAAPAVEIRHLTKTFGGRPALDDVSVVFEQGRITALLGQNGSGKSTLIKILAGFYEPDEGGEVSIAGESLPLPASPRDVHRRGVRFLHQDLAVVPGLSVSDNFALVEGFPGARGGALIHQRDHDARVAATLERLDVDVSPCALVGQLAPADQTMVAIARAFHEQERPIVVLDEPTASLPESEAQKVFAALRKAIAAGGSVVYVSHRLDEVQKLADDLVVLRDGKLVAEVRSHTLSTDAIVELMLGRPVEHHTSGRGAATTGTPVLSATGLTGARLRSVDVAVQPGEILGITGLVGCGRSELARILAGAQRPDAGELVLDGEEYAPRTPRGARRAGVGYVPQDRRAEGVIADMSVMENASLTVLSTLTRAGLVRRTDERTLVGELAERLNVRMAGVDQPLSGLSGGNQQKVLFARNAALDLKVLVLDEPSAGIDVGARAEIADLCREMAASGIGVVVGSTDFDEIADLCDRVLILNRGQVVHELHGDEITVDRITTASFASTASSPEGSR
ncbi:sugar ABC transporter ATP-binding protein [Nocardioides sp. C4-1]|uniref:sugar ABC transporter ATP-binding protein n=1 Tax=Nocardioides sp. C4-1 TaxID=3151851 RepID=UPI0032643894